MRLSTRLLLALLPTVAIVMVLFSVWAIEGRRETLIAVTQIETEAYTAAVGRAFDHAYRDLQFDDVRSILNEMSREARVYGVFVYDSLGLPTLASDGLIESDAAPVDSVLQVLRSRETLTLHRDLTDQPVYSVLRPIHAGPGEVRGVLEVVQPLTLADDEVTRTRRRFFLNTLTLLVVLAALVVWLVRRFVDAPLKGFIRAARGLDWNDLSSRAPEDMPGRDLELLALEFNMMAERLQVARTTLVRETEERLALEKRIAELADTEQRRMGQELHDSLGQQITAIALLASSLQLKLEDRGAPETDHARRIVENLQRAKYQVSVLIEGLIPIEVHAESFTDALITLADRSSRIYEIACHFEDGDSVRVPDDSYAMQLYRIAQEAVHNAVKHGGATEVTIELKSDPSRAVRVLRVRDNGAGFPETSGPPLGMGLRIMRHRASLLGGELHVRALDEGGVVVECVIPAKT